MQWGIKKKYKLKSHINETKTATKTSVAEKRTEQKDSCTVGVLKGFSMQQKNKNQII